MLSFTSLVPSPMLAGPDAFSVLTLTLCYSLACVWHEFNNMNEGLLDNTRGISEITGTLHLWLQGKEDMLSSGGHGVFEGWQDPGQSSPF